MPLPSAFFPTFAPFCVTRNPPADVTQASAKNTQNGFANTAKDVSSVFGEILCRIIHSFAHLIIHSLTFLWDAHLNFARPEK
jgi:hypothetical protein